MKEEGTKLTFEGPVDAVKEAVGKLLDQTARAENLMGQLGQGAMQKAKCDFCSIENIAWTIWSDVREVHLVDTERKQTTSMNSDAPWASCDACCEFVRAGDHEGLAKRSHESDPMPQEFESVQALAGERGYVQSNGIKFPLKEGMCFHSVLHEGLFWPGYKGRIEPANPETMVSRFVKIDVVDGDTITRLMALLG